MLRWSLSFPENVLTAFAVCRESAVAASRYVWKKASRSGADFLKTTRLNEVEELVGRYGKAPLSKPRVCQNPAERPAMCR
jgi:hypothetical protein